MLISRVVHMLTAIGFNDEPMSRAGEIDDKFADRVLPTETITRQAPITQDRP